MIYIFCSGTQIMWWELSQNKTISILASLASLAAWRSGLHDERQVR